MKRWMEKLISKFDFDWSATEQQSGSTSLSEDLATVVFFLDAYSKDLWDLPGHPVRRVREHIDHLVHDLAKSSGRQHEEALMKSRKFFSSYRIEEYTSIQKNMEDFRNVLWDLIEQLGSELKSDNDIEHELEKELTLLKDAVESDAIDLVKHQAKVFIKTYFDGQRQRDNRRERHLRSVEKYLGFVKKKLVEANSSMRLDHLTCAYNRKSFDEQLAQYWRLYQHSTTPTALLVLDIDHFKKINDRFGHAIGDFVLVECVKLLHEVFQRQSDFVARIGGEEFAVILPDHHIESAIIKAQQVMERISKEVFVQDSAEIRFTLSIGIALIQPNETAEQWLKRADKALYQAKNTGRNKYAVAETTDPHRPKAA